MKVKNVNNKKTFEEKYSLEIADKLQKKYYNGTEKDFVYFSHEEIFSSNIVPRQIKIQWKVAAGPCMN